MNTRIELLILEDEPDERDALIKQVDARGDDFHLVAATGSSTEAFNKVMDYSPDAVILDLELHKGDGDGFDFLTQLRSANVPRPPYILVTTWNISPATYAAARELGADYIMSKVRRGYSAEEPLKFLLSIRSTIMSRSVKDNLSRTDAYEVDQTEKRLKRRIQKELNQVGINPKSVGYAYLTDAIAYVVMENRHKVCNFVARKWNKAECSVERAMQNAINRAWNTADTGDLLKYYTAVIKSDRGGPTITEFIYYYAQQIRPDFENLL